MAAEVNGIDVTRHDLSLAVIGGVLAAGLLVGLLPTVDLSWSLFAASLPAIAGMVYTLFYRPPNVEPAGPAGERRE